MNLGVFILAGVIAVILLTAIAWSASQYLTKRKKMSSEQKFKSINKRFNFYYDFFLSRKMFRNVYNQVLSLSVYTVLEARAQAVKLFERSYLAAFAIFVIGFVGLGDIISGIVLFGFAIIMINTSINKRIDDINFKALKDISALILSIREQYTRLRNVPDSINEAKCPKLLQKQVDEIYLICTATDADERLDMFYKKCPNRIIRTLATTCYIRNDAGDDDGKESPFKRGLSLVKDEVDMEVRRQINQRLMFNSLDKLPFVPLFLYPPIRIFYVHIISATQAVFESAIGYVIKLVVVVTCFICYYILSTMNNSSVSATDDRISLLADLYGGSRRVRNFANSLVTNVYKKRRQIEKTIDGCLSSKNLGYLYLEKFVFAVTLFLVSILFSIIILISARQSVYNSLSSSVMSVSLTYTAEEEAATRALDAEVLAMDVCPSKEELIERFRDIFVKETELTLQTQAERLIGKYNSYHNIGFKWWLSIIYILCSIAGWYIPDLLLSLRAKLVKSEAEMDVLQLQTIIAILMDTPYDTLTVLNWLTKSSDIHRVPLSNCYHEYVRDPLLAIRNLKHKSAIPEFSAMCDKLESTVYQVTLAEAFEDLLSERDNAMKIREVVQLDQLKQKRNIASPIATAPMVVWVIAVFLVPLLVVAVKSAISMLANMEQIQQ